jgi:hypothetical protein
MRVRTLDSSHRKTRFEEREERYRNEREERGSSPMFT